MADNKMESPVADYDKDKTLNFYIYITASLFLHFLIIFSGFININFGKSDFDIKKSSLNVSVVEEVEVFAEKKSKVSQKPSGKDIDIETKSIETEPEIEKKVPMFSGQKKKLPDKNLIPQKKSENKEKYIDRKEKTDLIKDIADIKKEIESENELSFDKILKDIDSFKNDIGSQSKKDMKDSENMFSDLEKGSEKSDKINIYRYKIAFEVEKKWALPEELINKEDMLETSIVFTVLKNGTIGSIWFDSKSGEWVFW